MKVEAEMQTLRTRVGYLESPHIQVLRVEGHDAFEVLDEVLPRKLYLQDAQVAQTLLLESDGSIVADVQVARDDEAFFLLCETRPGVSAADLVRNRLPAGCGSTVVDLRDTHAVWSVHGPWAWELLGDAVAQEIIGQPYLSLQHVKGATCFRGGKTGEFGYDLLMPRDGAESLLERLRETGQRYELGPLSLESLDRAAVENWFHSIRYEALWPYTPLELQLQWRVSSEKQRVTGMAAVEARRVAGLERRLTVVASPVQPAPGAEVTLEGQRVGEVLVTVPLSRGDGYVSWAMFDLRTAVAGLAVQAGDLEARTISPPAIHNESLRLDPNKHSFRYGRLPA